MVEAATGVGVCEWVRRTVFEPLRMTTADIPGSPAHAGVASAADVSLFGAELARPTLVSGPLAALAGLSQFPALAGVVPGYGRFTPCPWGLGLEIRGEKSPHWTVTWAPVRPLSARSLLDPGTMTTGRRLTPSCCASRASTRNRYGTRPGRVPRPRRVSAAPGPRRLA